MNFKHGHKKVGQVTRTYNIWSKMIDRCTNPNCPKYPRYGGRGIIICNEWRNSYSQFLSDMGEAPNDMSIERTNNDLGYNKTNCIWATNKIQSNNRRGNHPINFRGKTLNLCQWATEYGINYRLLGKRLKRGLSMEVAINRPKQPGKKHPDGVYSKTIK